MHESAEVTNTDIPKDYHTENAVMGLKATTLPVKTQENRLLGWTS